MITATVTVCIVVLSTNMYGERLFCSDMFEFYTERELILILCVIIYLERNHATEEPQNVVDRKTVRIGSDVLQQLVALLCPDHHKDIIAQFCTYIEFLQALPLMCNNSTQFDCRTRADPQGCIPLEWLCDGLKDCKNGLDESHCSYLHSCPEGNFICRSGDCVSGRYKCDGEADCPGGEDESGCKNHETFLPGARLSPRNISKTESCSVVSDCPEHMFRCKHGPCIARAYICDGEVDCPLREDEHNCTGSSTNTTVKVTSCDAGMVLCADHTACFPKHWVCDGEADCLDGSDESDCEMSVGNFLAESVTELCQPGEHRCNEARKCIPLNRTCNGVRDCPNGDDEGARCNECQSRRTPCEFKCINTPQGSRCICPHGSVLNADEFSCTPKDECLTTEGKQCEHYCEDLHNSYQCTCAPGYRLGDDRHSCRLERDNEGKLFIAMGHEVRAMPLFESRSSRDGYETVQSLGSHGVVQSIDFLVNRQLIYMTISGSDHQGEVVSSSFSRNDRVSEVLRKKLSAEI
uniref:EGF-like domain-containing protein n=1 Tax=Angiostrongylus cantonensis TaxID=6313 RepID=A0A158PC48_ANGCA